ncbi:MAG: hypothetical protein MUF58_23310 [Arcicella sp.]|jgi:hypothetical protein|nr:hypothetical protein [Arcicella sp.]
MNIELLVKISEDDYVKIFEEMYAQLSLKWLLRVVAIALASNVYFEISRNFEKGTSLADSLFEYPWSLFIIVTILLFPMI